MNTLLFCFIVLQATIYTVNVETGENDTKVSQQNEIKQTGIQIDNFKECYEHFQAVTEKNTKQKKLYDVLVKIFSDRFCDRFCGKFFCRSCKLKNCDNNITDMSFKLLENYCNSTIEEYLFESKEHLMELYKISDEDLDFAFNCAYNMFVDISRFTTNTFREIHTMRKKYEDIKLFRQDISKNTKLLEKYILSVNWVTRLLNNKLEVRLLHNYNDINIDKTSKWYDSVEINYKIRENEIENQIDQKTYDSAKETLIDLYKKNHIYSKEKIFEIENIDEITDLCISKFPDQDEDKLKHAVRILIDALPFIRNDYTKIDYIVKTGYYADKKLEDVPFYLSKMQGSFLTELGNPMLGIFPYEIVFDTIQMYETINIVNFFVLVDEFSGKIKYLKDFTKQYIDELTSSIKVKLKKIFQKHELTESVQKECNDIDFDEVKQNCIDAIDNIIIPTFDAKNPIATTKIEEICKMYIGNFFDNACAPIFKNMKEHKKLNEEFKLKIEKLKTETDKMLNGIHILKFEDKISKITKLHKKINGDMQNTRQYKILDVINHTNNTIVNNLLQLVEMIRTIMQEQNKEQGETKKDEVSILSKIAADKGLKTFIKENSKKIINIINNIIELKSVLIEAEQDAVKLIEIIRKYNNDNNESINKNR